MLDKMLGVSPPPAGPPHDSKIAHGKELRGETSESKAKYKSDFEHALKKKLAKPKEEARVDKKDKKSSGGIKKKMTDVDDKMVSNGMASKENVVEIPDSKTEDPAEIKVDSEKIITSPVIGAEMEALSFEEAVPKTEQLPEIPQMEIPEAPGAAAQPEKAQSLQDFESELSAAVDFKPSSEAIKSNKELASKLKEFDLDKNSSPDKAQSFEKEILSKLQKESSFNSDQSSEKNPSGFEQKDKEPVSNLKSDILGTQMHQPQPQHAFKTHVAGAMAANGEISNAAKLEDNREANISEIMNQAKYLVKKGGGEMTVKMTPEGLGEVNLKVLLQDGKLSVDIQTQDKHVKKLVEESLSELKSGLAAHRLSLEHVKVDTVNATNADNNTQFQSNLSHGGSERNAQEFWNDIQSNLNQNSRQNSGEREPSEQPRASSHSSLPKGAQGPLRTYGGTKGATINRVA